MTRLDTLFPSTQELKGIKLDCLCSSHKLRYHLHFIHALSHACVAKIVLKERMFVEWVNKKETNRLESFTLLLSSLLQSLHTINVLSLTSNRKKNFLSPFNTELVRRESLREPLVSEEESLRGFECNLLLSILENEVRTLKADYSDITRGMKWMKEILFWVVLVVETTVSPLISWWPKYANKTMMQMNGTIFFPVKQDHGDV